MLSTIFTKKRVFCLCIIVLLLFMEMFLSSPQRRESSLSRDDIVKEMPEVVFSSEDTSLMSRLMMVVDSMVNRQPVVMQGTEAKEFGAAYFPESTNVHVNSITFSPSVHEVRICYSEGFKKEITLVFDENYADKTVKVYRGFYLWGSFLGNQWGYYDSYLNGRDGRIRKVESRHRWFGWLRDL